MGLWDNYKKRSDTEKEAISQCVEGLSPVEKALIKSSLKVNIGSSVASKLVGAIVDTIKGDDEKDDDK